MRPRIEMLSGASQKKNGTADEAFSMFACGHIELREVDEDVSVRIFTECVEDEPDYYLPPDVAAIELTFDRHEWAAFKGFIDSKFAEIRGE